MKKEEHLGAWLLGAFALEALIVFPSAFPLYTCIVYKPGYPAYPVGEYLIADVGFGLCILPIIAALRRGVWTQKAAACALAAVPLAYICLKVPDDMRNCLKLLFD